MENNISQKTSECKFLIEKAEDLTAANIVLSEEKIAFEKLVSNNSKTLLKVIELSDYKKRTLGQLDKLSEENDYL